MPDELWNEVHDIVQETEIKTIPMEKKCKKAKWLSGEALQIAKIILYKYIYACIYVRASLVAQLVKNPPVIQET